jgi:phage gpG-like protein
MSDGFSVTAGRLEQVVVELGRLGEEARARLLAAVTDEAAAFEAVVTEQKLSGGVLKQQTGKLRESVFHQVTMVGDGVQAVIGANAPYAHIHEYGGIIEPVNALALRFQVDGHWVMVRRVVMPERSFLRSTLAERAETIRAELARAVAGAA